MSVLRGAGGGGDLQRRLTKLYSDAKSSCQSVTTSTAYTAVNDPEFLRLKGNIRTQTDRLLAWGLDWSDASAAQPNDIDESLTKAGFSDVVESVMSSIQDLLNQADGLLKSGPPGSHSPQEAPHRVIMESLWSVDDIKRSRTVVNDLTACVDTLYDLSRSRRDMAAAARQFPLRKSSKKADEAAAGSSVDSKARQNSLLDIGSGCCLYASEKHASFGGVHVAPQVSSDKQQQKRKLSHTELAKPFLIDRSALQLSGASHDANPPPYEVVAASSNSRVVGRIKTSASPLLSTSTESTVSILVEFTPMTVMLETEKTIIIPASQRLEKVNQSLDLLVQNASVSHLGLLRFLGYYIDMPNARYAFVYQMPMDYFSFLREPTSLLSDWKPKPLVSFFQTGSESQGPPNLEVRFRLAYDLLMTVLHLRSQNMVHGNINSSNILIFPCLDGSAGGGGEVGLTEDFSRPYLTSLAQFSGNEPSPEPLVSAVYRHPEDKKDLNDEAAWAYDLYSLGLVLLEIGLWLPISRCWKMKYNNATFKRRIETFYVPRLGAKCGSAYLHMVQLCLDAPNFHLSTQPMADLSFRVPQVYHYPVLDLSDPDGIFAFSMNFLYTICKIAWSCAQIDIFAAPAAGDLDDSLPLALVPQSDMMLALQRSVRDVVPEQIAPPLPPPRPPPRPSSEEMRQLNVGEEKRIKKRTVRRFTDANIPQEHLNEWNFQLMPKLSKLLQKVLCDSAESCSASLMMMGESVETAKTTICVTCSNSKKVRLALKKHLDVAQRNDWDLLVLRGDVERSMAGGRKGRRGRKLTDEGELMTGLAEMDVTDPNPCYQKRPSCGASIGVFRDEEHSPPVTYGGTILVDGQPFGMTVHHMLEVPSEEDGEDEVLSSSARPSRSSGWLRNLPIIPGMSSWGGGREEEEEEEEEETSYAEFEVSDDEDESDQFVLQSLDDSSDEYESEDEEEVSDGDGNVASVGDTAGVEPDEDPPLVVTQPALDDVHENYFPVEEDRDEEHANIHSFGHVYASSGVRRWIRKGIKHEIDWALIKVDDARMDAHNAVVDETIRTADSSQRRVYLDKVARMEDLGGLTVHCCGRTTGHQSGQISRAMALVKLKGRQTFSRSLCVCGGGFGSKQSFCLPFFFFFFFC